MKIAISSTETSGDLLGSDLVAALMKQNRAIQIEGLVGEKMQSAGAVQLWEQKRVNVMGFSEVLTKLVFLLRLRRTMIDYFIKSQVKIFIGVDAPDFNFKIEKKLKQHGIKTIHFISPSLWAWRQRRIKKIKQSTDLVLCVFPFEVDFYQKNQQKALFIGHPLARSITPRKKHLPGKNILLMPGSREGEVRRLLPEMLSAMRLIAKQDSQTSFHLALAADVDNKLHSWIIQQTQDLPIDISIGDAPHHMIKSDLVLVASGTATLEAALVGVPMVVVYKLSALSYWIASGLLKSPYISLPNVISGKALVPELIQNDANGNNIAKQAMQILNRDNTDLIKEFNAIHAQLKYNSDDVAARAILALIDA